MHTCTNLSPSSATPQQRSEAHPPLTEVSTEPIAAPPVGPLSPPEGPLSAAYISSGVFGAEPSSHVGVDESLHVGWFLSAHGGVAVPSEHIGAELSAHVGVELSAHGDGLSLPPLGPGPVYSNLLIPPDPDGGAGEDPSEHTGPDPLVQSGLDPFSHLGGLPDGVLLSEQVGCALSSQAGILPSGHGPSPPGPLIEPSSPPGPLIEPPSPPETCSADLPHDIP